jgi:hypothetical protein
MTIKKVITTKAIASPSSRFISRWTRIEQHSLFAEAAKQISLSCRRSNSVPAIHEAQQHFGCAARGAIQFISLYHRPHSFLRRHSSARCRRPRALNSRPSSHAMLFAYERLLCAISGRTARARNVRYPFARHRTGIRRPNPHQDTAPRSRVPSNCRRDAYAVRVLSVAVASMAWTCRTCSRINSKTTRVRGARCRRDG